MFFYLTHVSNFHDFSIEITENHVFATLVIKMLFFPRFVEKSTFCGNPAISVPAAWPLDKRIKDGDLKPVSSSIHQSACFDGRSSRRTQHNFHFRLVVKPPCNMQTHDICIIEHSTSKRLGITNSVNCLPEWTVTPSINLEEDEIVSHACSSTLD